jgi:predicted  nucleic acid-binding Zn-ribbon protein
MMLQLELLWSLQCIDREINNVKRRLKDRTTYNQLSEIKCEYDIIKAELDKNINELGVNAKNTTRLNGDLKYLDQKIKDENERLYVEGSNIKIIENIQREMENYKKLIDETENKLLKYIEKNEVLGSRITEYKGRLSELKCRFEVLKKTYTEEEDRNKKDKNALEERRENIIKEFDNSLLAQYNNIALRKNNPVSLVDNGVCTECGVKLNAMLYDTLKRRDNINYCEHCGRILYIE